MIKKEKTIVVEYNLQYLENSLFYFIFVVVVENEKKKSVILF